jgi:sulfonate transport system permease protein
MERSAIRGQYFSIRGPPDFASLHPGYEDVPQATSSSRARRRYRNAFVRFANLHSLARRGFAIAMTIDTPLLQQAEPIAAPAPSGRLRRFARPALGLLLPVGLALAWEIIVWLGWSNGRLVPPPTKVFATIMELARSGELSRHIMATLTRVVAGFALGVIAGTILGAVSGYWGLARRLLDPTVQALRAIPSIAWVPLFILWLGIFETSKIALIAVGVFFPVYLGVMGAILSVDRKIVEVGRTFRLSGPAMIRRILLPAVLPAYVVSLRVGLGLGWMFVVAAEFMGASEGLGYLLIDGQQLGKPAQILAAIVIFAILGKTTDWLIEIGSAPLLRWQDAFGRQGGGA